MTTVQTRVRKISDQEGFDIQVYDKQGNQVNPTNNGVLNGWPHERATKGSKTVGDWADKFEKSYPGYSAKILNADGKVAHKNNLLSTVRETYEED
ncbi:MAG TPA: hypothetical protein VM661_06175 [Candidatus Sulfotelmatobacter sp.]|jgi:hypothetical protein|nr:hypothetical protein [Candidatus Sulfotelmatobacter sp.]